MVVCKNETRKKILDMIRENCFFIVSNNLVDCDLEDKILSIHLKGKVLCFFRKERLVCDSGLKDKFVFYFSNELRRLDVASLLDILSEVLDTQRIGVLSLRHEVECLNRENKHLKNLIME